MKRKAQIKLKKLGIDTIEKLDEQMLNANIPGLEDELNQKREKARGSSRSDKSSARDDSSHDEDLLEEFKRETERDLALSKEREETRQQKIAERKRINKERGIKEENSRMRKLKAMKRKRKKRKKYRSSSEGGSEMSKDSSEEREKEREERAKRKLVP